MTNIDLETVAGFGDEWSRFDQRKLSSDERRAVFDLYFEIFPWEVLPTDAVGFDLGCGSGRWAALVAPRVATLHCIDASPAALEVARATLEEYPNCEFHEASVDNIPLPDNSMDFGYSLGVLHHVPDTRAGIKACVSKLKANAPFLVYLYYAFDNRPLWFRVIWKMSDLLRKLISRLPFGLRYASTSIIAALVYLPLARIARILERFGGRVDALPLAAYRHRSFYTMRTDALDRFGTRLEQRFTAREIRQMMEEAGLEDVRFSQSVYWCAVGRKRNQNG